MANIAIEFGVKYPCEESWPSLQKLLIHKGKILCQRAKVLGSTPDMLNS